MSYSRTSEPGFARRCFSCATSREMFGLFFPYSVLQEYIETQTVEISLSTEKPSSCRVPWLPKLTQRLAGWPCIPSTSSVHKPRKDKGCLLPEHAAIIQKCRNPAKGLKQIVFKPYNELRVRPFASRLGSLTQRTQYPLIMILIIILRPL